MNDFKGLRDPHLNVFWQYDGKPHLENNITKALINTLDEMSEKDFRNVFSSTFGLKLTPGELKREFFLQKKPDMEKVREFSEEKRVMFAFSPTGKCYGFAGRDIKDEKTLFKVIKNEFKTKYEDESKLNEETEKAVKEYLDSQKGDSIPDAWIFLYVDGRPEYVLALENKLYDLNPDQLNNHIEKSLLILENKKPVIYRKYEEIVETLNRVDCYLAKQYVEYMVLLGYWEVNDFSLACSSDQEVREKLALKFGKKILLKLDVKGEKVDERRWNMARRRVDYDYLREINLLFEKERVKLSLAFGPTTRTGRAMLERLDSFDIPKPHLHRCAQSFHLLYQRGRNIGPSYIDCSYSLNDFIAYLKKNAKTMIDVQTPEKAVALYEKLLSERIITQENYNALSSRLSGKKNPVLVVPEIYVEYVWTYEELSEMGFDGFVSDLNETLRGTLLSTKQIPA